MIFSVSGLLSRKKVKLIRLLFILLL